MNELRTASKEELFRMEGGAYDLPLAPIVSKVMRCRDESEAAFPGETEDFHDGYTDACVADPDHP